MRTTDAMAVAVDPPEGLTPGSSVPPAAGACRRHLARAVLLGGLVSGVLDAVNGVVAFYLLLGLNPIQVLQFIASGALGEAAFDGGLATAGAGTFFHFLIAFVAAAVYVAGATRWSLLQTHWVAAGLAYGVGVWAFMNLGVLPLSAVKPVPVTVPLALNGIIGHAVNVGLPIAYFARNLGRSCPSKP